MLKHCKDSGLYFWSLYGMKSPLMRTRDEPCRTVNPILKQRKVNFWLWRAPEVMLTWISDQGKSILEARMFCTSCPGKCIVFYACCEALVVVMAEAGMSLVGSVIESSYA
ncbi:hypothetical protein H5410_056044 [Solanum commersonii]|uniref:Uncharacterized protein n=1 Tax=Solanum commersonii TaxID=4109 RepID=A0A9J5WLZ6_SOLCO|nr:hypothetical protein H5410_056044 [Solanum commersonii]